MQKHHILILGGDGYLGWPTAMHFSQRGYAVTVADSYLRRNACTAIDVGMLYDVPSLPQRAQIWHQITGREIKVAIGDVSDAEFTRSFFDGSIAYDWALDPTFSDVPETVIHYAEMPSAPYSMIDYRKSNFTIKNNLLASSSLLYAVRDLAPETHVIKLGTMGEYGTPNIDIEEGWLEVSHKGREQTFLYPRQAGSLYHTTKIMDTDLYWFGVRMWNLRITDLMQGPVYGVETDETSLDRRLRPIFNYDEIFGTIINRFVTQAVKGYPLTVYGKGGQTRGYLNIKDTLQCVYFAAVTPAKKGELRIFNQIMETFSASELAEITQRVGRQLGFDVQINHIENPRKEAEEHYYNPVYQGLQAIGVTPHFLTDAVMAEMFEVVQHYRENIREDVIFRGIKW